MLDAPCQGRRLNPGKPRGGLWRRTANDLQARCPRGYCKQPLIRVQQGTDVFPRDQRAHEKKIAIRCDVWLASEVAPNRRPEPACIDPLGRHPQPRDHQTACVLRGRDHGVRAESVLLRQRRIVAADLAVRALAVIEEVQIVDGDDPRGGPRRDDQRMRGVRDVNRAGE